MKSNNEKPLNENELEEKVKRCYITNEVLEIINKYNLNKEVEKGEKGEDKYVKTN